MKGVMTPLSYLFQLLLLGLLKKERPNVTPHLMNQARIEYKLNFY